MALYFDIKSGPASGQKFPIVEGSCIGRSKGEIILDDQKISSLHARVERDASGLLVIVDQNSSNGTWVNNQRVKTVAIMPGVIFRVGRTRIQIVEGEDMTAVKSGSTHVFEQNLGWKRTLADMVPQLLSQASTESPVISAFSKIVQITFIEGPQTDDVYVVGFGPRKFGRTSLDFELKDQTAPPLAFELTSGPTGEAVFSNKEPGAVLMNNDSIRSQVLQEGDIISFGQTKIQVSFLGDDLKDEV